MNCRDDYIEYGWSFNLVPAAGKYCRYYVKKGAVTKFNRGFRTRRDVDAWIEDFGDQIEKQDARILRIKLKGNDGDILIVNRAGEVYRR